MARPGCEAPGKGGRYIGNGETNGGGKDAGETPFVGSGRASAMKAKTPVAKEKRFRVMWGFQSFEWRDGIATNPQTFFTSGFQS